MMETAIGIDLGTTFSAVSAIDEAGRPVIVKNTLGESLTPSVIYFENQNVTITGAEAKEMQAFGETNIASFFKRNMGDVNFELNFHGKTFSATDLSCILLQKLKADAETVLNRKICKATITVPAYFDDLQRKATMLAAEKAGFKDSQIINEPTAAAIAFGVTQGKNQTIMVYDLGGGTFDVTLLKIENAVIRVIATGGDHELGGKDWDNRLIGYIATQFKDEFGEDPLDDAVSFNDLLVKAENVKKQLSTAQAAKFSIVYKGNKGKYEITRTKFEEITQDLLVRTTSKAEEILSEAGLVWTKLDGVLLVGGSTRMPMVVKWVERMSGKPPITGINVDEAVCLGAAIYGNMESSKNVFSLGGKISEIIDVTSHGLGLVAESSDRSRYINSIIIQKNKTIPVTEMRPFQIRSGRKNELEIYLTQGESTDVSKCKIIGKYLLSAIDYVQQGISVIDIEYKYTKDGTVQVMATQRETGKKLSVSEHVLSPSDDLSWLYQKPKTEEFIMFYNEIAGKNTLSGGKKDSFGNLQGNQFDLALDGAFKGQTVAVLHLYYGEGFDFHLPEDALKEKGFDVKRWTKPLPSLKEFKEVLQKSSQLWIISNRESLLNNDYLQAIKQFFEQGHGLFLWGDNDPFYADANFVSEKLFHIKMSGNTTGGEIVTLQKKNQKKGIISNHIITTGLEFLYEGITIATIHEHKDFRPLMYGSAGNLVTAFYEKDGKRAIIDGGFTRLYVNWDTAGTARFVKNAAAWLANVERFNR